MVARWLLGFYDIAVAYSLLGDCYSVLCGHLVPKALPGGC